jgi:hypothetical protein
MKAITKNAQWKDNFVSLCPICMGSADSYLGLKKTPTATIGPPVILTCRDLSTLNAPKDQSDTDPKTLIMITSNDFDACIQLDVWLGLPKPPSIKHVIDTENYRDLQQNYGAYNFITELEIRTVRQGTYSRCNGMARRPLTV